MTLLIFPKPTAIGLSWNWHLGTEQSRFSRLPWHHRASPFATLNETVASTDTDRMIETWIRVNRLFPAFAVQFATGFSKLGLLETANNWAWLRPRSLEATTFFPSFVHTKESNQ